MLVRLRQFLHRLDPGYLVVLTVCLLAIWPFISRASLPQETDAELHIFRLAELSYLVRGGELYPRWAPNFYHGYGYPIFNYYAPLTYYLGLPVELLPYLDAVDGVKVVFVLGLLAAAFGMYGFVRDNWGRPAGYAATAVYLYAPYVLYIDPHARGVLAESFSLGVFPLALWALDRLGRGASAPRLITAVFLTAALVLSHNLMGMLFWGVLLAWVGWRAASGEWRGARSKGRGAVSAGFVGAALLLGFLLAAFFWLPVLAERNAVNLNTLIGAGDNYDFRTHFLSWGELLTYSRRLDWGATQPLFAFNLGAAQWLLGGWGLAALLLRRARRPQQAAFFALSLGLLHFLMLPASTFVWEALPFLPYFQFPWRLLGPAAALLAVLAGVGLAALLDWRAWSGWAQGGLTAVFVALPLLSSLPLTQPAPWTDFGDVFPLRLSLIENSGRWLGTTSTADYVPATVDMIPQRNGDVVRGFLTNTPLDRVNRLVLPVGATVVSTEISPLHFRYDVDSPASFRLRLFLFDFPGWQVWVDGAPVQTELGRPEGFLVVPLSAGRRVVDVRFGSTPARTLAWIVSALALLVTLALAARMTTRGSARHHPFTTHNSQFTIHNWIVFGTAAGITAVTLLLLAPLGVLRLHSTGYTALPAETAVYANFGEQIALIGYNTPAKKVCPGDDLAVSLYWKAQHPLEINYQVFVHVLASDGFLSAQSDKLNPADFPTRRWPLDKYVRDAHTISLPPGLAPGTYTVAAGLWNAADGWRLPLLDASGAQIGDYFILFTLEIE